MQQFQLGDDYATTDAATQEKHVALLQSVTATDRVALEAAANSDGTWTATVCTPDALGVLSLIAGLLSIHRLDIVQARIYSIRLPRTERRPVRTNAPIYRPSASAVTPRRLTLDVFRLRAPGPLKDDFWPAFRNELATLLAAEPGEARGQVIDRISATLAGVATVEPTLYPLSIDVAGDPEGSTRIDIRSLDTPGFLFAFANALSGSTFNVERAAIDTVNGEAHDTFWITDAFGQPVTQQQRLHELRLVTALVKEFTYLLPRSPDPGQALRQFRALVLHLLEQPEGLEKLTDLTTAPVLQTLADLMGVSRFLWEDFLRLQHQNLYPVLIDVPALDEPPSKDDLKRALSERLRAAPSGEAQVVELNAFKDREMFRIDLRHITGKVSFSEFASELTDLAEVVVDAAAETAIRLLAERGTPLPDGWQWAIAGLGKFGGRELGFGSDIELLFVYDRDPDAPPTDANAAAVTFEEFVRTFESCIQVRQNGIFEIDLRLRPYGRAGPLASPLGKLREYYTPGGPAQQFERLALVKLRSVAGDASLARQIIEARDAFVYSGEPLDIQNVRHLRSRQAAELVGHGEINAKYSHGGLVDVEYYVQVQQILHGHTNPLVRVTGTLEGIDALEAAGHLSPERAAPLRDCYGFLRRLIDALRVVRGNAKDLNIPSPAGNEYAYLAHRLRFASPEDLRSVIQTQMEIARRLWDDTQP